MYAAYLYIMKAVSPVSSYPSQRGEPRREVPEKGSLLEETVAPHRRLTFPHIKDRLNRIIHVALGIHQARHREPHQLHERG